jgi:cyclic pyranopterin phosphate synthase
MPKEGITSLCHDDILTYEEIIRLCKIFVRLGINKIKLTGGEPLVRKDLCNLVRMLKLIEGIKSVTLTTNGVLLQKQLPELVKAGLDGVNISLDTLNPKVYESITGADELNNVLNSIKDALTYTELNVKINCVPVQGINSADLINLTELARNSRLCIRFIEIMPIGPGKDYTYYSEDKIIKELNQAYGPLIIDNQLLGNGPAHYYTIPDFEGKIGFISAITHQFCNLCNRVRLTSEGYLKSCLQYKDGRNLKSLLRGNSDDTTVERAIYQTICNKPVQHNFGLENGFITEENDFITYEEKQMFKIGG